ncbi:MAG: hypothetical protein NVS4B6_11910 [Mycobacterium sp.]
MRACLVWQTRGQRETQSTRRCEYALPDKSLRHGEHKSHGEYRTLMPDLVLESEYLGR